MDMSDALGVEPQLCWGCLRGLERETPEMATHSSALELAPGRRGPPAESASLLFFLAPWPAAQSFTVNPTPLFQGLSDSVKRPWKACVSDKKCLRGLNPSSAPSLTGGCCPGLHSGPLFPHLERKELDKMVPKEPSSPALLDLNVYIRRVKCLPEHSA